MELVSKSGVDVLREAALTHRDWNRMDPIVRAYINRIQELDISYRIDNDKLQSRIPHWMTTRMLGGSGFGMSRELRRYFLEFVDRLLRLGPASMPTSFNVAEAFLAYGREFALFDLRVEKEHLLNVQDYFAWYADNKVVCDPPVLRDTMQEGVVYSYDFAGGLQSFDLDSDTSSFVLAGISFVRQGGQLACIMLAGESPPYPSYEEVLEDLAAAKPFPGKENLKPNPSYTAKSRYLEGRDEVVRVIVLARFNLPARKYDLRYINIDVGDSYLVSTDDFSVFGEVPPEEKFKKRSQEMLLRYDVLFSSLTSLMFLPLFFVDEQARVTDTQFGTELYVQKHEKHIRETIKEMGLRECTFRRTVHCHGSKESNVSVPHRIEPPHLEFETKGFWKPLEAGQIGHDSDGLPVVGKTWVERRESWIAQPPSSFLVHKGLPEPQGPDPGVVYIVRSPSHAIDVYKVGLTRRTAEQRAGELSSATGVPLPFGVLANWSVTDCGLVEKKVHESLNWCRLNSRREFFETSLSTVIKAVEIAISEISK